MITSGVNGSNEAKAPYTLLCTENKTTYAGRVELEKILYFGGSIMKQVLVQNTTYQINGEKQFLISGELHYFRISREEWRQRLALLKEAGANFVSTYVPWSVHEPAEGEFHFEDTDNRDLEGFLKLCMEFDMFVICRPGPYINSELKMGGLPLWLRENYPETMAQKRNGESTNLVSYLHPVFLEKVRAWYAKVCPIIAKFTLSQGGPIAYVQLDNELRTNPFNGGSDYNPEGMEFYREDGRYANYLRKRYATIDELNEAYGTKFHSFAEVSLIDYTDVKHISDLRRLNDIWNYNYYVMAEYLYILRDYAIENGIDCPFIHNAPSPIDIACFKQSVERMGKDFILGSDHYYNLDMSWAQNNPTPQYALRILGGNEQLRAYGVPQTIFEMASGSFSEWPPITNEDSKAFYLMHIAFGTKGINYYIFAGGKNPSIGNFNLGSTSDDYDYNAPISSSGEIRPLYYAQKEVNDFLLENKWLADADAETDFRVGLIWDYGSRLYHETDGIMSVNGKNAWWLLHHGVLATAMCSTYMPEYIDLTNPDMLKDVSKPLIVASADFMPRGVQENLVRFVENGGRLLICPVIPTLDEHLAPCTLLRDFLEAGNTRTAKKEFYQLNVGDVHNVFVNEMEYVCDRLPKDAIIYAEDKVDGSVIGWKKKWDNGGMVMWLGLHWRHGNREHMEMFRYLMKEMSCGEPSVKCSNFNVWAVVRTDGNRRMLFLMNLFSAPMETEVAVRTDNGVRNLGVQSLQPMEVRCIEL